MIRRICTTIIFGVILISTNIASAENNIDPANVTTISSFREEVAEKIRNIPISEYPDMGDNYERIVLLVTTDRYGYINSVTVDDSVSSNNPTLIQFAKKAVWDIKRIDGSYNENIRLPVIFSFE